MPDRPDPTPHGSAIGDRLVTILFVAFLIGLLVLGGWSEVLHLLDHFGAQLRFHFTVGG
jgi:hypothetical protein